MMEVIYSARRSGKTTRAVELVKAGENRILAVMNEQEKRRIMDTFGLKYQQVETWGTLLKNYYCPALCTKEIAVDNVDLFIRDMFSRSAGVRFVTLTDNDGKGK